MQKKNAILQRMKKHADAVEKAHAYLATGDHANWHGFRPLFGGSRGRAPHPDWVANVFLPRRLAALARCERTLEQLERRNKERQISQRHKKSN